MNSTLVSSPADDFMTNEVVQRCACCGTVLEWRSRPMTEAEIDIRKRKIEFEMRADVARYYGPEQAERCVIVWGKQKIIAMRGA